MSNNEPLNIDLDLSGVSTSQPLVRDGHVGLVSLENISGVVNDDTGKLEAVKWEVKLVDPAPAQDRDGNPLDPVNAGFPLFVRFGTQHDFLLAKQARFIDAFLGTGDRGNRKGKPERPVLNASTVASMIGLQAIAKITVRRDKKSDYVGNDIDKLTHVSEI